MEIDLHGLTLEDALDEICYKLEECRANMVREISLIHGFHRGQIIKNYFESEGFIKEMKRAGFLLKRRKSSNPGVSIFFLMS
ncbi:MAG: Smr/MutS family protein [Promethearchaeota archaeon]